MFSSTQTKDGTHRVATHRAFVGEQKKIEMAYSRIRTPGFVLPMRWNLSIRFECWQLTTEMQLSVLLFELRGGEQATFDGGLEYIVLAFVCFVFGESLRRVFVSSHRPSMENTWAFVLLTNNDSNKSRQMNSTRIWQRLGLAKQLNLDRDCLSLPWPP